MRSKLIAAVGAIAVAFLLVTNPVIADAAKLITGNQIKNNSVTTKDIKNNNLTGKDIKDNKLTGKDINEATLGLVPRTAARGTVQTGLYSAWGSDPGYLGTEADFASRLPVRIPNSRTTFIAVNGAFTAQCPGIGQVTAPGWLCVYERNAGNRSFGSIFQADVLGGPFGTTENGFGIYFDCTGAGGCWSYGAWAVQAGNASDVGPRPSGARAGSSPSR